MKGVCLCSCPCVIKWLHIFLIIDTATCTPCGVPSVVLEMRPHWPGQAIPGLNQGSKWNQVRSKISCSRERIGRLAETRLVWLILPRGTGGAEHCPAFLQFSAVPSQFSKQCPSGPAEDGLNLPALPRSGSPSWRAEAQGDTGSLWFPEAQPGAQTRAWEWFKNKQPDLDLFLHFREAEEQVSLSKQSPFLQWHFKDDSTL